MIKQRLSQNGETLTGLKYPVTSIIMEAHKRTKIPILGICMSWISDFGSPSAFTW